MHRQLLHKKLYPARESNNVTKRKKGTLYPSQKNIPQEKIASRIGCFLLVLCVLFFLSQIPSIMISNEFIHAVQRGDTSSVAAMLRRYNGHPYNYFEPVLSANTTLGGRQHYTVLMDAASCGHKDTVELLVSQGANATYKNLNGKTASMLAEQNRQFEIAAYLRKVEVHQRAIGVNY